MAEKGSFDIKVGLAEMLKGGVIMDVMNDEQAKSRRIAGELGLTNQRAVAWAGGDCAAVVWDDSDAFSGVAPTLGRGEVAGVVSRVAGQRRDGGRWQLGGRTACWPR